MNAPLAEFNDYNGLRKALNTCREQRDLSFERMDEITGAPPGYFAKLLGPRAIRRIGLQSLGWAFGGLGIKCVVFNDPEALAKVESRFGSRDVPHLQSVQRGNTTLFSISVKHLATIQAKGRKNRWGKMTDREKSLWGKRMRKLRNRKIREQKLRARQRKAAHKARKQA
jgi:hypothetical protein